MENTRRPKYSCNPISAPTSKLAMHTNSHVISKLKPKVRIIHIFAPEIIKTDVANFRELVQRLTGKPGDESGEGSCKKDKKTRKSSCCHKLMMIKKKTSTTTTSCESNIKTTMQFEDYGSCGLMMQEEEERNKMEEENEIWGSSTTSAENSSDFFDGFADFNGFIHDLSESTVSLATPQSSQMDVFGDMHPN